jgi:hypothetical protein
MGAATVLSRVCWLRSPGPDPQSTPARDRRRLSTSRNNTVDPAKSAR